ncbi:MAG: hypothetical protein AAGD35_21265 [Actinomycetota bacterium]
MDTTPTISIAHNGQLSPEIFEIGVVGRQSVAEPGLSAQSVPVASDGQR